MRLAPSLRCRQRNRAFLDTQKGNCSPRVNRVWLGAEVEPTRRSRQPILEVPNDLKLDIGVLLLAVPLCPISLGMSDLQERIRSQGHDQLGQSDVRERGRYQPRTSIGGSCIQTLG